MARPRMPRSTAPETSEREDTTAPARSATFTQVLLRAEEAGIDPFEFRWRNIGRPGGGCVRLGGHQEGYARPSDAHVGRPAAYVDQYDATLATAFAVAKGLKKGPVLTADAAGFLVNRLLLRSMGEVLAAIDEGTPADVADAALAPLGMPMSPLMLLEVMAGMINMRSKNSMPAINR